MSTWRKNETNLNIHLLRNLSDMSLVEHYGLAFEVDTFFMVNEPDIVKQ